MKYITTLLLIFIGWVAHSQTYEEVISEAYDLYTAKQYAESTKTYSKAFEIEEGQYLDYYNAACSSALSGDSITAIKFLKLAADNGWTNIKHIKRDSDLESIRNVKGWEEVLNIVQANLDEYEKDFNKPLKEQLEKIYVKDQMLRQMYEDAERKFGEESEEMTYFWQLVSEQDRLNEIEVEKIIEEHGWLGKSVVGGQANTTIWLVVQHGPLEMQIKYLPLLKESVKVGESRGDNLALLEDRILMYSGKPQIYGSQIVNDPNTGEMMVYEIQDPEYVNQRRKEVGLGPIETYVKIWGIEWTIEQKEK